MSGETGGDRPAHERRGFERYLTCYPLNIQVGDRGDTGDLEIALIQDLSARGAFVLTTTELRQDARVKLHLDFGDPPVVELEGRVLRCERRPPDRSEVWRYGAAIELVVVTPELAERVVELARGLAET
ncbi:MAG: PilZ domain-containing protein [Polyangiaceae bacterium]|jgi:hypothetical protein|nr:PilZ domain-containing protein [Polyangiaceae bacterium]MBK8939050.1 PilZ domain-containing protein [Polyangiaceae bacterium]